MIFPSGRGVYSLADGVHGGVKMQSILRRPLADKVILIHRGALGDFLSMWPAAWALSREFAHARLCFAGNRERLPWLEPLGFTACSPEIRIALDGLHGADRWPGVLERWAVFWFVIDRVPDVPAAPYGSNCFFVRSLPGTGDRIHVRDAQAEFLDGLGIPSPQAWLEEFRRLFAAGRTPGGSPGKSVLLFPGAGHPLKQWPMVQYFQLADRLERAGLDPLFVLGPAELERGLIPGERAQAAPGNLQELQRLILSARAVVGGDTGPMHLAGMLGVPGVALFGPTSFAQWGPAGLRELSLGLPCSPCTATCADLDCPDASCLGRITPAMVFSKLEETFDECKTGFQGPGFLESRF